MIRGPGKLSTANVAHHLKGARFPASRNDLLKRARNGSAGQDVLEVLESLPQDMQFETLADVENAYAESDQAPQTGIIDVKP
jgi:hypothetical protein